MEVRPNGYSQSGHHGVASELPNVQADLGAERTLLGSILFYPKSLGQAIERLNLGDIFLGSHRIIYQAMLELNERGAPVEPMSLLGYLTDIEQLERAGGASYLASLQDCVGGSD